MAKYPYTVAFADEMHADGIALARELFTEVLLWSDSDYERWIEEADGICNRAKVIPTEQLKASKRLRVLSKQGVGVDTVDLATCHEKGVVVCNTPGINADAVAELSLGLVLSLLRRISELDRRARAGEVTPATAVMGRSLSGKTIGIVGMGNIGRLTAEKFQNACGCSIIAYDPFAPADIWSAKGTSRAIPHERVATIEDMLSEVDVLSLHLPLTPTTRGMINRPVFARMKRDAVIVNAARGGIINEDDLYEALRARIIAGAALDALEVEPPTKERYGNTFYRLDNLIVTPHIGAATHEMQSLSARTAVEQLARVLQGEEISNIVK
ncbi:putative phosphoglycerate dehydrogenase [Rhodotorula sp. JG-1b]|nr:putative phosphoglycerate dehydrogenase [Rhodotorula sp. JG-1b]